MDEDLISAEESRKIAQQVLDDKLKKTSEMELKLISEKIKKNREDGNFFYEFHLDSYYIEEIYERNNMSKNLTNNTREFLEKKGYVIEELRKDDVIIAYKISWN